MLRGGALEELNHLLARLDALPSDLITAGPATLVWVLEKTRIFYVSSLRLALTEERFSGTSGFPSTVVWGNFAPSKVQTFLWMVFHKKFATIDNLQRRGFYLVNWCVLCCHCSESVDHLLLLCDFSSSVWAMVSSTLSIFGPFLPDAKEFVTAWKGMNCIASFSDVMKVLMHATFWYLWMERNDRIFRDKSRTVKQIFVRIMIAVGRWLFANGVFSAAKLLRWNNLIFDPG
ncbi:hypothetical protein LINGRAHAP2_LOCUS35132 [Linum grandiflorum]